MKRIKGNIVDVHTRRIYNGIIEIADGIISGIEILNDENSSDVYIMPGFIDSHIHIESSMVTPFEFSKIAKKFGTIAVVADPHEIANVLGVEGVKYMLQNSRYADISCFFCVPSCVPATGFETSGGILGIKEVKELIEEQNIVGLAEMMNFPGVVFGDDVVLKKLEVAKSSNFPIDGHAPGLRGFELDKYVSAGISTDHECFTIEEAEEKISKGMIVQLREGSAAKNFEALWPLIDKYPGKVMFCSDDLHPDNLMEGHINRLVKRALKKGCDLFNVLLAANVVANEHYKLGLGKIRVGDRADFIVVDSLQLNSIQQVFVKGENVLEILACEAGLGDAINKFVPSNISVSDLRITGGGLAKVIVVENGSLVTQQETLDCSNINEISSDTELDVLKMVVVNRYEKASPALGLVKGFKFLKGAIATSVAHDSHNVIAVGTSDAALVKAVNALMESKGGMCVVDGVGNVSLLELPVAGLMSNSPVEEVAFAYKKLDNLTKELGSKLDAPFMTLSFMSLLVIPELKLGDRGLFDVGKWSFVKLVE